MHILKNLFPRIQSVSDIAPYQLEKMVLVQSKTTKQTFAIPQEDVTARDKKWLALDYDFIPFTPLQAEQNSWSSYLSGKSGCPITPQPLRSMYVHIRKGTIERKDLQTALEAFFSEPIVLIMNTTNSYTCLSKLPDNQFTMDEWNSLVHLLESDLYCSLQIGIGSIAISNETYPTIYQQEYQWFHERFAESAKIVVTKEQLVIEKIMDSVPTDIHQHVKTLFDTPEFTISELLATIEELMKTNLNLTQTANNLHIHRNTLLYRIGKVHQHVGLDLRTFEGVLLAYMTLRGSN